MTEGPYCIYEKVCFTIPGFLNKMYPKFYKIQVFQTFTILQTENDVSLDMSWLMVTPWPSHILEFANTTFNKYFKSMSLNVLQLKKDFQNRKQKYAKNFCQRILSLQLGSGSLLPIGWLDFPNFFSNRYSYSIVNVGFRQPQKYAIRTRQILDQIIIRWEECDAYS